MPDSPPIDPALLNPFPLPGSSTPATNVAAAPSCPVPSPAKNGDAAEGVSKAAMEVKAKKNSESRQRKRLEEVLRRAGSSTTQTEPHRLQARQQIERRFLSCENCRIRKFKCSRHKVCTACRMRNEPCVWAGGAPSTARMTPYAIEQELLAMQTDLSRLSRLVHLLTARYTLREARLARAEGRPVRRPPGMLEVLEGEMREEEEGGKRGSPLALEDAEALLALATPTVYSGRGNFTVAEGDVRVDEPVAGIQRPSLVRSATTSYGTGCLAAAASYPAPRLGRSLTDTDPPVLVSRGRGPPPDPVPVSVPVAELAYPHLPSFPSFPAHRPVPPAPPPTFFYPLLPSPQMPPHLLSALAATRAEARQARVHPHLVRTRREAHEERWRGAVERRAVADRAGQESQTQEEAKGDEDEEKRREEARRVAAAWAAAAAGGQVDGAAGSAVEPYESLSRPDDIGGDGGNGGDVPSAVAGVAGDLVASALDRQQAHHLAQQQQQEEEDPAKEPERTRPTLSLDAAGAFSALSAYALLRTPSALSAGWGLNTALTVGAGLGESPVRSAVEEGLRPLGLGLGAGEREREMELDERLKLRAERARVFPSTAGDEVDADGDGDAWDRFEPKVEKKRDGATDAMDVDGDVGAETETDGRSSVGRGSTRSRRSGRSDKAGGEEEDSEEELTDEASD